MTLIDGDKIVTAQLYDDEHEEFTEKKMSIIDFVNAYSDEGVTTADDVLGKIRDEIDKLYEREGSSFDRLNALDELKEFIDKYKAETEEENVSL